MSHITGGNVAHCSVMYHKQPLRRPGGSFPNVVCKYSILLHLILIFHFQPKIHINVHSFTCRYEYEYLYVGRRNPHLCDGVTVQHLHRSHIWPLPVHQHLQGLTSQAHLSLRPPLRCDQMI